MKNENKLPFETIIEGILEARTSFMTAMIFDRIVKKMISTDAQIEQMEDGARKKLRIRKQEKAWTKLLSNKKFDCIRITNDKQSIC